VDASAGSIKDMFDFGHGYRNAELFLDPSTGTEMPDQGHGHDH
jgi:hypothetical protein